MTHWGFIVAAYGVTLVGTAALAGASWLSMRRAERDAEALRQDR